MPLSIKTAARDIDVQGNMDRSLLDLAIDAGLHVNARCASGGVCGSCTAILESGQFVIAGRRLSADPDHPRTVLACQTKLASQDAVIRFPRTSIIEQEAKIDEDFSLDKFTHHARTRKLTIDVPSPQRRTPDSMWRSLETELQTQMLQEDSTQQAEFGVPLGCLRKLPDLLRDDDRLLTVTLGRIGDRWSVLDVEAGDTRDSLLGVAVDIGTTTVVAMLIDLNHGRVLKKASMYNQQIRRADDVASRIALCRDPDAAGQLQRLVIHETINPLIQKLASEQGVAAEAISRIAISGNTVMTHLFLGISPQSIGHVPFQPVAARYDQFRGCDLQLTINPNAIVDVIPSVSGYVGGDIVSDIYVARLTDRSEATLLVDIGTNGEMVYSENGVYSACSTAAGPAFEGYGTAHGCRAATGAIEHISFDRELRLDVQVIGGGKATGLCGSALIDFIACGMRCGLINDMGRYNLNWLRDSGRYVLVEEMCGDVHAFVVVDEQRSGSGEAIYISEADVAQILKAKAAIYAGMKTLLEQRNKRFAEIKRFCLAGGFARHIDLHNAILIGLLPEIPLDRFDVLGNGSLAGAMLALVDADAMDAYDRLVPLQEVVELNLVESFESHFIDALALPNLNNDDFPQAMDEVAANRD